MTKVPQQGILILIMYYFNSCHYLPWVAEYLLLSMTQYSQPCSHYISPQLYCVAYDCVSVCMYVSLNVCACMYVCVCVGGGGGGGGGRVGVGGNENLNRR